MAVVGTSQPQEDEGPPSSVRVYLKNREKAIDGLDNLAPEKEVVLTVRGKVSAFNSRDWLDKGADFELAPESVTVSTEGQVATLDDAITSAEKTA